MTVTVRISQRLFVALVPVLAAACMTPPPTPASGGDAPGSLQQVLRGRQVVIEQGCADCHGGGPAPAKDRWLSGAVGEPGDTIFVRQFRAWPRNITPHAETGIGRYSERQIFNALRYGLRPKATPDVEITSSIPGQGGHPANPNYLSPGMPWLNFRYMPDADLRAIAAYLKRAVVPVNHRVEDSEAPPDFWASDVANLGTHVPPAFPTVNEQLTAPERRDQVLRGRRVVMEKGCAVCHGGGSPARSGWLAGLRDAPTVVAPFTIEFPIGPFKTRPRNLTPDNTTGMGRFTERQIFNSLRYGLRPGETPDVEITSTVPGQGNHPANPKYLAPPMPWPAWRHLPDADLRAIAAYLKNGLKPVRNLVADSDGPPDFWAGYYVVENIGPYPAPPFPTRHERVP